VSTNRMVWVTHSINYQDQYFRKITYYFYNKGFSIDNT